ncbi:MAG: hypothetical protein Q8S18_13135 [Bacteroidales bacterium]|nr:hypothetical protein [Bacteroidales bacterium]
MQINRQNYEAWLLDHIEGRLSAAQSLRLMKFVNNNPELGLWEELTGELTLLQSETISYEFKNQLKKSEIVDFNEINSSNFDFYFVSWHEGLLDQHSQNQVDAFLQLNPQLINDFEAYKNTKLKPDHGVVFANKESIKKKKAAFIPLWNSFPQAIAASLLILISLSWWFWSVGTKSPVIDVAVNKPIEIPETKPANQSAFQAEPNSLIKPDVVRQNPVQAEQTSQLAESALNRPVLLPDLPILSSVTVQLKTPSSPLYVKEFVDWTAYFNPSESNEFTASENSKKSVIGMVLANTTGKLFDNIFPDLPSLPKRNSPAESSKGVSLWDLASAGVDVYNALADKDVQLTQANDHDNNITAYRLQSDRINMNRNIRNNP